MSRPSAAVSVVTATSPEVQAKWDAVDRINLGDVKRKLMLAEPEGFGLEDKLADSAIESYRRYLKLCAKYPDRRLVPSHFIDNVWHQHILDTRAYARDCNAVFGDMLHHYPYFGLNGDAAQRDDAFDHTDILFIAEFGITCKVGSQLASMCDGEGGGCDNNVGRASMCDGEGGGCDNNVGRASMCDGDGSGCAGDDEIRH